LSLLVVTSKVARLAKTRALGLGLAAFEDGTVGK
jgi:hypothetical protein